MPTPPLAPGARDHESLHVQGRLNLNVDAPTQAMLTDIMKAVTAAGGKAVIVGGAVRDMVAHAQGRTGAVIKDVDVEVFGVPAPLLQQALTRVSRVDTTGAAFEVLKVDVPGSMHPIDVSMPRRETVTGDGGHRGFAVEPDPTMTFAEAARRRDFTIGAMGYDLETGELLDPYGGARDLETGTLRHVSDAFDEDPLRALRAARFAARLNLTVHVDTAARCRALRAQAHTLPTERIWGELSMMLMQAATPGVGLHVLNDIDWIDVLPELAALRGVHQDPRWHPEGDVFVHTAHVIDYWGTHLRTGNPDDDMVTGVAALCHDLGKASTTEHADGRWRARGHEQAGVEPTQTLLHRLGQVRLAGEVVPLVANHLAPVTLYAEDATDRAVRRLSVRVPRLDLLAAVSVADAGGRPPLDPQRAIDACRWLLDTADRLGLTQGPPANLARGSDLIDMGLKPGPQFRELLDAAYQAQLDGHITTSDQAREFLAELVRERPKLPRLPAPAPRDTLGR